jgi:HEAT repeat protein
MIGGRLHLTLLLVGVVAGLGAVCEGARHDARDNALRNQAVASADASPAASVATRGAQADGLNDPNPGKRAAAACALGKKGAASAVPALIRLLDDGERIDPKLICYRGLHDDQTGQPEMEGLREPSPGEAAVEALVSIGEPSVEPLIAALGSGSVRVRKNAAWALAQVGDRRALLPLIEALKDSAWQVRASAAAALGEQRDERAIKPLVAALKDDEEHVRWFAAASLGQTRDHDATEPLITALRDPAPRVRAYAAASLGQMRDTRAVEPLIAALGDSSEQVRMYAAASLGPLGDARAVGPLTALLNDDSHQVRSYAQSSLDQLKH